MSETHLMHLLIIRRAWLQTESIKNQVCIIVNYPNYVFVVLIYNNIMTQNPVSVAFKWMHCVYYALTHVSVALSYYRYEAIIRFNTYIWLHLWSASF